VRVGRFGFVAALRVEHRLVVYAVVDEALSPDFPLGDAVEVFIRRVDAEQFIEEVRGDDPDQPLARAAQRPITNVRAAGQRTASACPRSPIVGQAAIASSASQNTASPCSKRSCGPWITTPPGEKMMLPTSWNNTPRPG
jgi:hypothetical protein